MRKIKRGDLVMVIAGKDKGRTGHVIRVVDGGERVVVENVNMAKCHVRPNPARNEPGGIIEREMPLHVSNVLHYNPRTKRGERVGIKVLEDGRRVRYFKSDGEVIDV
ncbi:MAG: 50S ribosomal protein L24 [Gammaproteobacteria bacterium]|nr:MAG: 50S ribosomal protein L24 [Gammaproteobacteria bacterium]